MFLELTSDHGAKILVNPATITFIEPEKDGGCTVRFTQTDQIPVIGVKEGYEMIRQMLSVKTPGDKDYFK